MEYIRQIEESMNNSQKGVPQPLPEELWGEQWRIASIMAGDIVEVWVDRPIPILHSPPELNPITLGLSSTTKIPGVVIYGGRQSMKLARFLQQIKPVALDYIATDKGISGGLILEGELKQRWILVTFEDEEMAKAAETYQKNKEMSRGLHFLLIQPDESNMTYSGFWLLQEA